MNKFYAKDELKNDYGLVVEGENIYCINNLAKDFRIK